MEIPREIMTPEEVAEYLQLDEEMVFQAIRDGMLPASSIGQDLLVQKIDADRYNSQIRAPGKFVPRVFSARQIAEWIAEDQLDEATIEAWQKYRKKYG